MKKIHPLFSLTAILLTMIAVLHSLFIETPAQQVVTATYLGNNGALPNDACHGSFLPLILYDPYAPACSPANNYCEDFDSFTNPYGPLRPHVPYPAYPDDENDFYYFRLPESATAIVHVTQFEPEIGWLLLFDTDGNQLASDLVDVNNEMRTELHLDAGSYIIWVFTVLDESPLLPYNLIVDYPLPEPPTSLPVLPLFSYNIYEDFEGSQTSNIWWSPEPDVFPTLALTTERARNGTQSFKIVFEKDDTFQFFAAELREDLRDLSQVAVIDVWVYGEEELLLKLVDSGGHQAEVGIQSGRIADGWSLLRYRLSGLNNVDLHSIQQLLFFPAPGSSTASGMFFLDDLTARVNPGTLEDFNSTHLMTWWTPDQGDFLYYETREKSCWIGQALRVDYDKHLPYAHLAAEVPQGIRDFSWAQTLEVRIYGVLYLMVKFEDEDGNEAEVGALNAGSPNSWTKLIFNFAHVNDEVDLTRIKHIRFFPYPGSITTGTFYVDNISIHP